MHRVRLIHWNAGEAEERAGRLRRQVMDRLAEEVLWNCL